MWEVLLDNIFQQYRLPNEQDVLVLHGVQGVFCQCPVCCILRQNKYYLLVVAVVATLLEGQHDTFCPVGCKTCISQTCHSPTV